MSLYLSSIFILKISNFYKIKKEKYFSSSSLQLLYLNFYFSILAASFFLLLSEFIFSELSGEDFLESVT